MSATPALLESSAEIQEVGSILGSPQEGFLCVVPKSALVATDGNRSAQTGCLPYEGDRMLAVILSEAMLLAKDTEITDPTILSRL